MYLFIVLLWHGRLTFKSCWITNITVINHFWVCEGMRFGKYQLQFIWCKPFSVAFNLFLQQYLLGKCYHTSYICSWHFLCVFWCAFSMQFFFCICSIVILADIVASFLTRPSNLSLVLLVWNVVHRLIHYRCLLYNKNVWHSMFCFKKVFPFSFLKIPLLFTETEKDSSLCRIILLHHNL